MLPDVVLYDEHGEEFSTTSLRGQYSVLVFGCLT
jgi:cytochrome oxidase Cu insertion factor (SCO1/SenC/PrrC family)